MNEFFQFPVTYAILAITVGISLICFGNESLKNKLLFYPYGMDTPSTYYRFLSHGFIHADYIHLFFNMFTLYSFGRAIEYMLFSRSEYIIFYITALAASSVYDFIKNRRNARYAALGASGAVSAVVFATIIFNPWEADILLFGIPFLAIPNILFAGLYLAYCIYMEKRGGDNVGHSAHFWGSVYGFVFTAIAKPDLFKAFLVKLVHPPFLG